jgi:hypothetical protein
MFRMEAPSEMCIRASVDARFLDPYRRTFLDGIHGFGRRMYHPTELAESTL